MNTNPHLKDLVQEPFDSVTKVQFKWWLWALSAVQNKAESQWMAFYFDRWFTEKHTKDWFTGDNCEDAKVIIRKAIADLQDLGR